MALLSQILLTLRSGHSKASDTYTIEQQDRLFDGSFKVSSDPGKRRLLSSRLHPRLYTSGTIGRYFPSGYLIYVLII